jgi:propanediol dehydratase large subunit
MRTDRLQAAKDAAEAFLRRCHELETNQAVCKYTPGYEGGKYTAAVRRASMELTRMLATLRRPDV